MTLIATLLATMMLLALGGALTLSVAVERQASASQDLGREALHAAEAAVERALDDLGGLVDWDEALDGSIRSSFVDGDGTGMRSVSGFLVDLDALTTELNAWQAGDGAWRLFAHAPLTALTTDPPVFSRMYALVWISADPSRPGAIVLMAHAYGPSGVRRMVEAVVERTPQQTIRLLAWKEHRQ